MRWNCFEDQLYAVTGALRVMTTTLDLYTDEDRLWIGVFGVTSDNSFRMNGGDDGTRTRGLCRDRAAF